MKLRIEKYKAFFFDFDGVIVDSVNIKTEAFAELYKPFGEKIVSKVVSHHSSHGGMSRFEKLNYYHENFLKRKTSESEITELAQKFSNLVMREVLIAPFINGALEFLELLKKKSKKIFVISATPEDEIKKIITKRELGKYFTDVKGSPSKKRENIEYLIEKYHIAPSESIYFGDSGEDLSAASSLNIAFIPLNYFNQQEGYRDFVELAVSSSISF